MPFHEPYEVMIEPGVADLDNAPKGGMAGSITAALFLKEFVGDATWMHLDIAGPMKVDSDQGIYAKGATGFGTRVLIDLASHFTPPT